MSTAQAPWLQRMVWVQPTATPLMVVVMILVQKLYVERGGADDRGGLIAMSTKSSL